VKVGYLSTANLAKEQLSPYSYQFLEVYLNGKLTNEIVSLSEMNVFCMSMMNHR
jgi:hypothetical protein